MTIVGLHTLHELTDLLASQDYQYKVIADAVAKNPPTDSKWLADWATFSKGWLAFRSAVGDYVSGYHPLGPDYTVVQMTDSLNLTDADPTPHVTALGFDTGVEQGDWWHKALVAGHPLQDLYNRLTNLSSGPGKLSFVGVPQPSAPDSDLNAYKVADAAAKKVDDAANAARKGLAPYAIGAGAVLALVALIKLK